MDVTTRSRYGCIVVLPESVAPLFHRFRVQRSTAIPVAISRHTSHLVTRRRWWQLMPNITSIAAGLGSRALRYQAGTKILASAAKSGTTRSGTASVDRVPPPRSARLTQTDLTPNWLAGADVMVQALSDVEPSFLADAHCSFSKFEAAQIRLVGSGLLRRYHGIKFDTEASGRTRKEVVIHVGNDSQFVSLLQGLQRWAGVREYRPMGEGIRKAVSVFVRELDVEAVANHFHDFAQNDAVGLKFTRTLDQWLHVGNNWSISASVGWTP